MADFNVFTAPGAIAEEWQEIFVPFAALKQIGFGKPLPRSAADLIGLHVEARNAPVGAGVIGPFELEIDWVRLESGAR